MAPDKIVFDVPLDEIEFNAKLDEIEFNAKDVEAATRGLVNSGVLRSWVSRKYIKTELVFPRQRGRAAKYGIGEIHLFAIAAELRQIGLPMLPAVFLATEWTLAVLRGQRPHYIFWRGGGDEILDGDDDDFRFVSAEDWPAFDPFEDMGDAIAGLHAWPVVMRVNHILTERYGSEDEGQSG